MFENAAVCANGAIRLMFQSMLAPSGFTAVTGISILYEHHAHYKPGGALLQDPLHDLSARRRIQTQVLI